MIRTLAAILLAGLAAMPGRAQPVVGFEDSAVVVEGLTAGGSVACFGIARERPGWITRVVRRGAVMADDDGDGVVRLELGGAVARSSIWAAVDLASGAFTVATPHTFPRREIALPGDSFRRNAHGAVEALQDARGFLEILLARPGQGA